jgi:hypothetical protein
MNEITTEDREIARALLDAYEHTVTKNDNEPIYRRSLPEGMLTAWRSTDCGGSVVCELTQRYSIRAAGGWRDSLSRLFQQIRK